MGEWKHNEWREKLRTKPARYWIRDEIEEIIKQEKIDRTRFYEYSKFGYEEIINRFYYAFVDHENRPKVELAYCWLKFREELKVLDRIREGDDWIAFLQEIHSRMPETEDDKFYMILSEGWVYEGYAEEIFAVLNEVDCVLEDFYIVSRKFNWFVSYCTDAGSAMIFQK